MAKKITKSKTKKRVLKTSTKKTQKEENSFGITILIIAGLILLIYFASNIDASVELSIETSGEINQEVVSQEIIISGITYTSDKAAIEKLRFVPQSQLTDEERAFVERTSAAILILLSFLIVMNAAAVYIRHKFERKW